MQRLFDSWNEVRSRLRSARAIALFLDFDGTLARLRAAPPDVSVDRSLRQELCMIVRSSRFRVWVVSGRRRSDVRERLAVRGIRYLGLHGWERRAGARLAEEGRSSLECVRRILGGVLVNHPSIWVEDKEYALTLHHRAAPPDVRRASLASIAAVLEPFGSVLRISAAKYSWEIIPRELEDKGVAVRRELAALASGSTPVYVGDDVVDEPAFAALASGITIRVGPCGPTRARYFLRDVGEVRTFLRKLHTDMR